MKSFCITAFVIIVHFTERKEMDPQEQRTTNLLSLSQRSGVQIIHSVLNECPVWFFYNHTTKQCECYNIYPEIVECINQKAFLKYHYYIYSNESEIILSQSYYYDGNSLNRPAAQPGFIELPSNISELNDYMCGSANRKGFLCSECVDGFGPSATSPKFRCSNCSNTFTKYSVVIYLLSELIPVTIFYLFVLIFQINLTSSPIVGFVLYSQVALCAINYSGVYSIDQLKHFLSIVSVFFGIWNLNFFHSIIPPFCISPKLQIIHIVYLQSVSTIFPFILITITWICIVLYSCDCVIFVRLWRALKKLFPEYVINKVVQNSNRTVIDTFATFFLLSYAKLMFVIFLPFLPVYVHHINDTTLASYTILSQAMNPHENLLHSSHFLPTLVISIPIFLTIILPPVVLLAI